MNLLEVKVTLAEPGPDGCLHTSLTCRGFWQDDRGLHLQLPTGTLRLPPDWFTGYTVMGPGTAAGTRSLLLGESRFWAAAWWRLRLPKKTA